jgi:hypothetical protein
MNPGMQCVEEAEMMFRLQEDAKHGLCGFLEENNIDLVITGSATTSRFRKTLNVSVPAPLSPPTPLPPRACSARRSM